MFRNYQLAYLLRNVKIKEVRTLTFHKQGMAYVLAKSARHIPHGAVVGHLDMTPVLEYGKKARAAAKTASASNKPSVRPALYKNLWPFLVKAIAHCLHDLPELNSFLDYATWRTSGTVYVAEDINVGFTVHTDYGVLKPVLRNPHRETLATVADQMASLSKRARHTDPEALYHEAAKAYMYTSLREFDLSGLPGLLTWLRARLRWRKSRAAFREVPPDQKLSVQDILGATTTVANIGVSFTGHHSVGVIMPPEIMTFGVGDVRLMPWVVDGKVEARPIVTVAVSIDHRAYDGGDAFPMFGHMKRYVEAPELIYEWQPSDRP